MSLRLCLGAAACLVAGSACAPKPTTTGGPRTTEELRAEWDAALRCRDVEACLKAVDKPRYVLETDARRMARRLATFGEPAVPHLAKAARDWTAPRRREIARAALLAMERPALDYARKHDDEQGFDLLVRLALETTLLEQAYPALVERLPRQQSWLHTHLLSNAPDSARNPGLAVVQLVGSAAASEIEPLCRLLDGQGRTDWNLAVNTALALGFIGSGRATDCLVRAMDIPSWRVTSAALEGLARIGEDARGAQQAVLRVATRHWSQRVRWRAVTTLRFLRQENHYDQLEAVKKAIEQGRSYSEFLASADAFADPVTRAFDTVPANDSTERENMPVCAWKRRNSDSIEVQWQGSTLALLPLDTKQSRARRTRFAEMIPTTTLEKLGIGLDVSLAEAVRDIRPKGADYLVATCAGEFGGGLLQITAVGKVAILRRGCFVAIRALKHDLWVFEGSQHLGDGYGRVWRTDNSDSWTLLPVVDLPGNPIGTRVVGDRVLVATNLGDVAVSSDGSITPFACEPQ